MKWIFSCFVALGILRIGIMAQAPKNSNWRLAGSKNRPNLMSRIRTGKALDKTGTFMLNIMYNFHLFQISYSLLLFSLCSPRCNIDI